MTEVGEVEVLREMAITQKLDEFSIRQRLAWVEHTETVAVDGAVAFALRSKSWLRALESRANNRD